MVRGAAENGTLEEIETGGRMSDAPVTPDLLDELRAVHRARTDEIPSLNDSLALIRAIEIQRDRKRKLWTPDVLKGLLLLGINADEWQAIEESCREAFHKIAKESLFPDGELTPDSLLIGIVRSEGVESASKHEFVAGLLTEALSKGRAEFFERLASAIREDRERTTKGKDWLMPADSMRDRASWFIATAWNRSVIPNLDFPPFAFWSYDAITEFCEDLFKISYGREGIRRRIADLGLKVASVVWVRGLEHERDGSGFRLIFKKRGRSVKGHKSDKSP